MPQQAAIAFIVESGTRPNYMHTSLNKRVGFMSILPLLRSLLLTMIFSFTAPVFVIGGGLISVCLLGYVPGLQGTGGAIAFAMKQFLATFGSGSPWQGLVVIGFTCSLVGALFDTYAFYRYRMFH